MRGLLRLACDSAALRAKDAGENSGNKIDKKNQTDKKNKTAKNYSCKIYKLTKFSK